MNSNHPSTNDDERARTHIEHHPVHSVHPVQTNTIGPFTKPDLLAALDLQRAKFRFLIAEAAPDATHDALAHEIAKGARRDLIVSTVELITEYCLTTDQTRTYHAQPWYQFARVLRNSVLHYRGEFVSRWPRALSEKGITELRWRHLVLRDHIGEMVRLANDDAVAFWEELRAFAERDLR